MTTKVKQESFDSDPVVVPSETPSAAESVSKKVDSVKLKSVKPSVEGMTIREYIRHVALWNDIKLSGKVFLGTFMVFYFTSGKSSHTVPGVLTMWVLTRTLTVFGLTALGDILKHKENSILKSVGDLISKTGATFVHFTRLPNESSVKFWVSGSANYIEQKLVAVVETLREAEHDIQKLKVVFLHLFAVVVALLLFSIRTLFFGSFFIGMIVPAIYSRQYEKIDPVIEKVVDAAKPHADKVKTKLNELLGQAGEKLEAARKQAAQQVEKTKAEVSQRVSEKISQIKHKENTEPKKTK